MRDLGEIKRLMEEGFADDSDMRDLIFEVLTLRTKLGWARDTLTYYADEAWDRQEWDLGDQARECLTKIR
jgi:hypothetical protein